MRQSAGKYLMLGLHSTTWWSALTFVIRSVCASPGTFSPNSSFHPPARRVCKETRGRGTRGTPARCPRASGPLRPTAAATVPAAAVHRLPHTSRTRTESGGHIAPGPGPCRRDRARTGDKYTADCPGHRAPAPGSSWVVGAPSPPFSVSPSRCASARIRSSSLASLEVGLPIQPKQGAYRTRGPADGSVHHTGLCTLRGIVFLELVNSRKGRAACGAE